MVHQITLFESFKDVGVPLLSAVVGAILGGVPPWLLAARSSKEVLERDAEARKENELSLARQVFVKLSIVVNEIVGFHTQIEAMIAKADADGNSHMPIWQRLSTYAGIDRNVAVEFEASELAVFVSAGAVDYVDELILLSRRHAAILTSLATFGQMRADMHYEFAKHGKSTRADTGVSLTVAKVPTELANYFKLKAEELDLFAQDMRRLLKDYAAFSEKVGDRFGPTAEAYFGPRKLPYIERIPMTDSV